MSPADLVADLRGRGVRLAVAGGCLRVEAPKGALTQDLREELAQRKGEILEMLRAPAETKLLPLEWVRVAVEIARGRREKCFLCRWILDSFADGRLQPARLMHNGQHLFPVRSQLFHLELEYGVFCDAAAAGGPETSLPSKCKPKGTVGLPL